MKNLKELKDIANNLTLLYVEDDNELRDIIEKYLLKFFTTVKACKDGEEALEEYKKNRYDIIITDIKMPRLNGLQMATKIKEINEMQDIIILSAYSEIENYVESIKIGIEGYILKPINYEHMNQLLFKVSTKIKNKKENEEYKNNLEQIIELKTIELKKQFLTDSLTGLYNKNYLDEILKSNEKRSLLLINIDNFGILNDNYGFDIGDSILIQTAHLLESFEFSADIKHKLFRLQGDEFVFLFENDENERKALFVANYIKKYFDTYTFELNNLKINISFTMAIDFGQYKELLRNTSLSIHEIREIGKNHIKIFENNSEFQELQKNNIYWISRLKYIIANNAILPFFQPIVDLKTNKIKKYESLARIIDNENIISPIKFLKPAKLAGLISEITKKIIVESFKIIQNTDINISINIVEQDFKENYLIEFLEENRILYNLSSSQIILEILESISISEQLNSSIIEQLNSLKELGYKLSIDDFGTENSNFSRLLSLKVDYIKIDGCFIKNLDTDLNSQKIVKAIVNFAHSMKAEVIAEYVHNEAVYAKIKEFNIDYAQGYYLGKPQEHIPFELKR
jgi:diguanylate cyclase (GGDEF)-like protein